MDSVRKLNEKRADSRIGERKKSFFLQANKRKNLGNLSNMDAKTHTLASTSIGFTAIEKSYKIEPETSRYPTLSRTSGTFQVKHTRKNHSMERSQNISSGSAVHQRMEHFAF
jgi:hypothetical protein